MRQLTALENPNSVQQMKEWLTKHGLEGTPWTRRL
jgi:DNA polymerase